MNDSIFRKKNMEKIKSPENLNDYIRASDPSVWLLLISVAVLLIGVCLWGIFGHLESTVTTTVLVQDGEAVCLLGSEIPGDVTAGMTVRFGETKGILGETLTESDGSCAFRVIPDSLPAAGLYEGVVVTEEIKPISFILN